MDGDWCYLETAPCTLLDGSQVADDWTWIRCNHEGVQQVNCLGKKQILTRPQSDTLRVEFVV